MDAICFVLWVWLLGQVPPEYSVMVWDYSQEHDVDPALMAALMVTEHYNSRDFDPPYGESSNGSSGLMQIWPGWVGWMEDEHGLQIERDDWKQDPETSIMMAAHMLSYMEDRHAHHTGSHTLEAHWKCGEKGRSSWDDGGGGRCKSSSVRAGRLKHTLGAWWVLYPLVAPVLTADTCTMHVPLVDHEDQVCVRVVK